MKKRKVLIVITTGFVVYGGLATVMLNYYRAMRKEDMQIDFASTNPICNKLNEELKGQGSNYYQLPFRKKKTFRYFHDLKSLISKEKYDVVHINGNSSTMLIELLACKLAADSVRIAHVHTTKSNYPILNRILQYNFIKLCDIRIAVSQAAGEWLFKKDFIILNNAIDLNKYRFNLEIREKYRNDLGVNKKVVIGTVGKINFPKNHFFMVDVFSEYHKINKNSVLVIVGDGPLRSELEKKIVDTGLEKNVMLLGMREDANFIIQSFDYFLFTSKFEGLGLALIEAQACGLECLASDTVPNETKVTNNVAYLSLNESPLVWAKNIIINSPDLRGEVSIQACKQIEEKGYSIVSEAEKLRQLYVNGLDCYKCNQY